MAGLQNHALWLRRRRASQRLAAKGHPAGPVACGNEAGDNRRMRRGHIRINSLRKYAGRNPNGYFNDLEPDVRMAAWRWLGKLTKPWGRDMPLWRQAILIGQAKRLALNPPDSAWGRSMLGKRGGHAVQRNYLVEGRHPPEIATRIRVLKQVRAKKAQAEAEFRKQYGLPAATWVAYLPLD